MSESNGHEHFVASFLPLLCWPSESKRSGAQATRAHWLLSKEPAHGKSTRRGSPAWPHARLAKWGRNTLARPIDGLSPAPFSAIPDRSRLAFACWLVGCFCAHPVLPGWILAKCAPLHVRGQSTEDLAHLPQFCFLRFVKKCGQVFSLWPNRVVQILLWSLDSLSQRPMPVLLSAKFPSNCAVHVNHRGHQTVCACIPPGAHPSRPLSISV